MPRLIDADALKSWIDCGHLRSPIELCFSEIDVIRMLDKQPTIDAVPVCHSAWESEGGGYFFCKRCEKCIVCIGGNADLNFCPNCGAKMDLEVQDEG